ncbi:radical SAM family heme chaperone HemW [Dietzia sp. ANT_WB102]|uniref:radical SAM family heme chaperone HemW n=1 Tax=Dietzia sp. ANT_WB102 TaxID=2597345 RepID=UPI0011EFFBFE|nr:radical SAM family heme chaperone HemW [Dietzia sp. ANT_WB102]KAA0917172.1 coproporphyrinogen III oxidase [Dietzia sp. ANT_WB102]
MTTLPDDPATVASAPPVRDPKAPFGVYLHVPFCSTRCGYCDFNTYTAGELGSATSPVDWERAAAIEIDRAAQALAASGSPPEVDTVFIGGGTPSLVGADVLVGLLDRINAAFGLTPGAEVTTESNPESTSPEFFARLREGGFTRISLGMQSTAAHVLRILDRTHTPGRPQEAVAEALQAGFEHVNLDVIYGTPGETDDDLARTLDAVVAAGVDHVSAYSLIVEDGTALARRIRRGEMPGTVDDVLADRYEQVAERLARAGFHWYEVSNFATDESAYCRHNMGYWRGGDWWGIGPGAHSHVAGARWWNIRHPARYASACDSGQLPVDGGEILTDDDRHTERIMTGLRLAEGLGDDAFTAEERTRADTQVSAGLLRRRAAGDHRGPGYALTDAGRLLADGVVRDVLV